MDMEIKTRDEGDDGDTISNIIPFLDLVKLLERVCTARTNADKLNKFKHYFEFFREKFKEKYGSLNSTAAGGDSIFCIIRILCPSWDRERSSYGVKDFALGRMFAKIIGIDKDSSDGRKLFKYKNPNTAGSSAGDMGSIIFSVLNRRFSNSDSTDGPTVHELHQILDQLAKNKDDKEEMVTQNQQIKILQSFVRRLGALEGKWLAKIILKKMDLGVKESSILNLIHPKAKELLDTTTLEEVCVVCNDPDVDYVPTGKVTLFTRFKSMLCERLNIKNDDEDSEYPHKVINSKSKKNPLTLPPPPFYVETKFDGERFQIHFQRNPKGEAIFRYFSRGNHEYKEFNESLTPRLKDQLVRTPLAQSFIIDGEMMAYNYKNKNFTTKGQNIDVKFIRPNDHVHCPAFIAWDLVFLNGESICEKPLFHRTELLNKVLLPKESVYYISGQKSCETLNDVMKLLDEAIENCEEGIIVKDRNSIYEPGQRKSTWLKLKPEYVEGFRVSDLDLLIIGGFYADRKRRGGKITSLLLGILDGKDVYPLTKVGCGRLKFNEMAALISSLEPNFVQEEIISVSIKFKGKRPDVFIDPKKSIVLEVNASEILQSNDYALNYCLRFPVVSRVRRDKPWDEAMTVSEFHKLRLSCKKGKMVRKREAEPIAGPSNTKVKKQYFRHSIKFEESSDEEGGGPSRRRVQEKSNGASSSTTVEKKRKPKAKVTISPSKILAITNSIAESNQVLNSAEMESNIFQGKVFAVLGSWQWKTDTEVKLKAHGAEIVKNPTSDTFAIIAEKQTETVKHKIIGGKWDILKGRNWIEESITTKSIRSFIPGDMIFATETTKATFSNLYDAYGDSYTKDISIHELKPLLQKILQENVIPELLEIDSVTAAEELALSKREIFYEIRRLNKDIANNGGLFFDKIKVVFYPFEDACLKAYVKFYGGTILEDLEAPDITHVIVLDGHKNEIQRPNASFSLLRAGWIEACVQEKKLVSDVMFRVSTLSY